VEGNGEEEEMKGLLDFISLFFNNYSSRPAGLQASERKIQLTSVGVFFSGAVQ